MHSIWISKRLIVTDAFFPQLTTNQDVLFNRYTASPVLALISFAIYF
jgi:hypothetical protein